MEYRKDIFGETDVEFGARDIHLEVLLKYYIVTYNIGLELIREISFKYVALTG